MGDFLALEVTHSCNNTCTFCSHQVRTSKYRGISKRDYGYIRNRAGDIGTFYLTGGEPLCFPRFEWLIESLRKDFPDAKIVVMTNGLLVDRLRPEIAGMVTEFRVSAYPGFNDDALAGLRYRPNVHIMPHRGMWNIHLDPDLSEERAKEVYAACPLKQARLVGTWLYGCCLAETVERVHSLEPVNTRFKETWRDDVRDLPTWRACQRCFKARIVTDQLFYPQLKKGVVFPDRFLGGKFNAENGPRVFGIGLSHTGTRSLTVALNKLGVNVRHFPLDETTYREIATGRYNLTLLKKHGGLTDVTAAPFYAQFDEVYPGSKFILTTREPREWLDAWRRHVGASPDIHAGGSFPMQKFLRAANYGCHGFDHSRAAFAFQQHYDAVRRYFQFRPDDLLELDVVGGDGWERLCAFLGKPVPEEPFPHLG